MSNANGPISRRRALGLGGGIAGGLIAASSPLLGSPRWAGAAAPKWSGPLPVQQIEDIMETTGTVMEGVLMIELDRNDLHVTGPHGVPFLPPFQENHQFFFQPLGNGRAIVNGEMSLLPSETNPVIDQIVAQGLVFQAFHQHFVGENPQTFHIHLRGVGDPLQLARALIAVVKVTATPLPQSQPSNPSTPLPADQLAHILGGTAQVGGDGVVTVSVPRAEAIVLGGVAISPQLGVDVSVVFEPLGTNGQAACAPDYALIASEVNPALGESRMQGFEVHCLYNQETAEQPQLYFSHNLATGNAVDLAHRVSRVLEHMNVRRS